VSEIKSIMWKIILPVSTSTYLWNPVPGRPGHHSPAIFLSSNESLYTTNTASFPRQNFYSIHVVSLRKDKKSN